MFCEFADEQNREAVARQNFWKKILVEAESLPRHSSYAKSYGGQAMNNLEAKIFAAELGAKMPELDLHGYYPNEALEKLEVFLFRNSQNKETMVRIIYGFGTGKLAEEVLKYLKKHPLVEAVVEKDGSCVVVL